VRAGGGRSAGGLRTFVWGSDANGRSLLRPGDDVHFAADHPHPLFHAHEAETFAALAHGLGVESAPVVSHGQHDVVARAGERHPEPLSAGMRDGVSERLLSDAKQADGDVGVQQSEIALGREFHYHVVPLCDFGAVRREGRSEAEDMQRGGM